MAKLHTVFETADYPPPYVIAVVGPDLDGSLDRAHALVDAAAKAGVDAVEFVMSETAGDETPATAWDELGDHAKASAIDLLATAFDFRSLDLVCDLDVAAIALGSGEVTNRPLLVAAANSGLPVICATGMSDEVDVTDAVEWLDPAPGLVLLHCVSSEPAPLEEANLRAMATLRSKFGIPVGWADHTNGIESALAAVALGAAVVTKQITLDPPAHAGSIHADGLRDYVARIRGLHTAMGDGRKAPAPVEAGSAERSRRSWHAAHDLQAGELLDASALVLLRPATGIAPAVQLIGRRTARAVAAGEPLRPDDIEP